MVGIDVGREDVKRPGVARHFEGFRWDGIEGLVALGAGALLQHGPAPAAGKRMFDFRWTFPVSWRNSNILCIHIYIYIPIRYTHYK